MAKNQKSEISLKNFYIFNSQFGPKEGEEEKKVLFYHPEDVEIDTKIKDVGLSEAIIKFSNTFTAEDDSVQSLHTQKTCQLFYQPESDFWMVMTVNVPYEKKTKNNIEYNEYHGDDLHDMVFQSVLKQAYKMFRLFTGTFTGNLVHSDDLTAEANLIGKIENFYSKYVLTIKLQYCDILNAFGSVQYLPLSQLHFLRVQNFINMIESSFTSIKQCIYLFNEQVVWSGITPEDLYSVYEYLNGTLFPSQTISSLQGTTLPQRFSLGTSNYRLFITGPKFMDECITAPKLYIEEDGQLKPYLFVVYKALSATICMFVEGCEAENDEFFQELNAFIGPQMTTIASDIAKHFQQTVKDQSPSVQDLNLSPKFIYLNGLENRHLGTIHVNNLQNRQQKANIPDDVMNLMTDLYADSLINDKNVAEEVILKTHEDYWIVRKSCNSRHIFIVLNKTSSTLIDVNEETKRVVEQNVKNVFF